MNVVSNTIHSIYTPEKQSKGLQNRGGKTSLPLRWLASSWNSNDKVVVVRTR